MVDTIVFTFDEYWFYSPLDRKFHTTKSITHPPQRSPCGSPIKKRRFRVSEPPFGISGGKHRIGCPGFRAGSVSSDSPAPVRHPGGGKHPSALRVSGGKRLIGLPRSYSAPRREASVGPRFSGGKRVFVLPCFRLAPRRETSHRTLPLLFGTPAVGSVSAGSPAPVEFPSGKRLGGTPPPPGHPRYMRSGTLMPSSAMPLRITSATSRARARRIERIEAFSSLRIEWSW